MAARVTRIVAVFLAIGVLFALTRDSLPDWMYLTVLAGGIWIAFRLWHADTERGGRRGR